MTKTRELALAIPAELRALLLEIDTASRRADREHRRVRTACQRCVEICGPDQPSEEHVGDTFHFGNVGGDAGNIDKRTIKAGGDVVQGNVDRSDDHSHTEAGRDVAQGGEAANWKGLAWTLAAAATLIGALLYALSGRGDPPTPSPPPSIDAEP